MHYLANEEKRRNAGGPTLKDTSAVSAKLRVGVCVRLHKSCAHLTCTTKTISGIIYLYVICSKTMKLMKVIPLPTDKKKKKTLS